MSNQLVSPASVRLRQKILRGSTDSSSGIKIEVWNEAKKLGHKVYVRGCSRMCTPRRFAGVSSRPRQVIIQLSPSRSERLAARSSRSRPELQAVSDVQVPRLVCESSSTWWRCGWSARGLAGSRSGNSTVRGRCRWVLYDGG